MQERSGEWVIWSRRTAPAGDEVPLEACGAGTCEGANVTTAAEAVSVLRASAVRGRTGVVVFDTVGAFTAALDEARTGGAAVGLVPTMGSLHAGHASLISRARAECDVVAVTVFVNPTQFDDVADLAAYPRDPDGDVELAGSAGADMVLMPAVEEVYPEGSATVVSLPSLSGSFEGESRPGHFDGVATVVAKLFAMTGRCRAYFGEKDYQQLALVRTMARDLCLPVEVIGCPTVRDADGLALSSRNARLSAEQRKAAPVLYRALLAGRRAIECGSRDRSAVESIMRGVIGQEPLARLDYAAAVDASDLSSPDELGGAVRLLVAARVGAVRLIDNLGTFATTPELAHPGRRQSVTTSPVAPQHRLDDERHPQ